MREFVIIVGRGLVGDSDGCKNLFISIGDVTDFSVYRYLPESFLGQEIPRVPTTGIEINRRNNTHLEDNYERRVC